MAYLSNIARSKGDPKITRSGPSSLGTSDRLAKALGWFSLGLGLTELLAPGRITRTLGLEGKEGVVRAFGVASGAFTMTGAAFRGAFKRRRARRETSRPLPICARLPCSPTRQAHPRPPEHGAPFNNASQDTCEWLTNQEHRW